MFSAVAFGLNPTADALVPRNIRWNLSCRLRCMAGKGMSACGMTDQATCVQVSVKLCLTCSGVLVCNHLIICDLRLQFCHNSSDICLRTRELPVSAIKVMCAAVVGGIDKALKGSQAMLRIYIEFATKSGMSAICYTEEGSVHLAMLLLLLLPLTAATLKGTWATRTRVWRYTILKKCSLRINFPFRTWPVRVTSRSCAY